MRTASILFVTLLVGCSDDGGDGDQGAGATAATSQGDADGGTPTDTADDGAASDTAGPGSGTSDADDDAGTDAGTDNGADGTTMAADDAADADDGGPGAGAPVELYRGPVLGGVVPNWDPRAPRPLLMMGRLGTNWVATLAMIGPDGSLSSNAAEEIVVWGWDVAPPQLYDGDVGGSLPGWSAESPYPVVLVGSLSANGSWTTTLSSIDAAGTLGDNVADRLIVWGWDGPVPGAPTTLYDGPIVGGSLDGWDDSNPVPLVMLARLPASDVWQATLASIAPDGTLSENLAEHILVWGW